MHFKQVQAFRFVMMTGSASRAAELLKVSQPAVSRSIAELERSVGFTLFNRIRGRLVATPEAHILYQDVTRAFIGLERLEASAARIRDFGTGEIKIASLAALGSTLVPRALRIFHESFPDIAVTLQVLPSSSVKDLIASGQFDLGLVADEVDTTGLEHQVLATARAVCALPPHHPLAARDTIRPADLDGEAFVALAPEDRARQRIEAVFAAAESKPKIMVETIFSSTICALVLQGLGAGLVNPLSTDGFAEQGLVFRRFEPAVYFKMLLIFNPDRQKSRAVQGMIKALMAARTLPRSQKAIQDPPRMRRGRR